MYSGADTGFPNVCVGGGGGGNKRICVTFLPSLWQGEEGGYVYISMDPTLCTAHNCCLIESTTSSIIYR